MLSISLFKIKTRIWKPSNKSSGLLQQKTSPEIEYFEKHFKKHMKKSGDCYLLLLVLLQNRDKVDRKIWKNSVHGNINGDWIEAKNNQKRRRIREFKILWILRSKNWALTESSPVTMVFVKNFMDISRLYVYHTIIPLPWVLLITEQEVLTKSNFCKHKHGLAMS